MPSHTAMKNRKLRSPQEHGAAARREPEENKSSSQEQAHSNSSARIQSANENQRETQRNEAQRQGTPSSAENRSSAQTGARAQQRNARASGKAKTVKTGKARGNKRALEASRHQSVRENRENARENNRRGEAETSAHRQRTQQGMARLGREMESALDIAQRDMRRGMEGMLSPLASPAALFTPLAWWPFARGSQSDLPSLFDLPRSMTSFTDQMFSHMRQMQEMAQQMFAGAGGRTQVSARGDEYVFSVELPGFSADEVEVLISQDRLRVIAEKTASRGRRGRREEGEQEYLSTQHMERVFALASDCDGQEAEAQFRDGLLTIRVPRGQPEARKARRLEIEEAEAA